MLDILRSIWWGRSGWSVRDDSGERVPLLPFDTLGQLPGSGLGALSSEESASLRTELRRRHGSRQRTRVTFAALLLVGQLVLVVGAIFAGRIDGAIFAQSGITAIVVAALLLDRTQTRSELRASLLSLDRCPSCGQPLPPGGGLVTCSECGSIWKSHSGSTSSE